MFNLFFDCMEKGMNSKDVKDFIKEVKKVTKEEKDGNKASTIQTT